MRYKREKANKNLLAFTSFAIGLTEIFAGDKLDKFLGTGKGENRGVFCILGVREVLHGFDLLAHKDKGPGVVARVAGDILDTVLLAIAAGKSNKPENVALAAGLVLPVVALDIREASEQRVGKTILTL